MEEEIWPTNLGLSLSESLNYVQLFTNRGIVAQPGSCLWSSPDTNAFVTPWIVAHQAPLLMEFSSKNTGMGCHSLPQGILPDPGIEPRSPTMQADSLPSEPQGKLTLGFKECLRAGDVWPKLTTEQELSGEKKRKGF